MLKFDIVFTDQTAYIPYDSATLQLKPLGGSEASLIRIAEALGSLGFKVAVLEHCLLEPSMGQYVYYLPMKYIDEIKAKNHVMFRGIGHLDKLPGAKKFSWHQDVGNHRFTKMVELAVNREVTYIAASRWHRAQLRSLLSPELSEITRIKYAYNPLPDSLNIPKRTKIKYDKKKFVWLASPHKGLERGIEEFAKLRDILHGEDIQLYIFNPGYLAGGYTHRPWIKNMGPQPCMQLWQHVSESFCVFYPTQFEETFGCIAAEAGALHTPVATMRLAALAETAPNKDSLASPNDYPGLLKTVERWYQTDRPEVKANQKFLTSTVIETWLELLKK